MSNPIEILNEKIVTDKEILYVMPKNTKKNTRLYVEKVEEVKQEYENYLKDVVLEIKRRVNRINLVQENPEINETAIELKKFEKFDLFSIENTSYEKMKLDELLFVLRRFYKNNLEQINNNILNCIKSFARVGVELKNEDFNYSPFTKRYMQVFFEEYKKGDVNSQKMKDTFEQIYWECSDIIIHIELNIRFLYLKNESEIDKYLVTENAEVLKELAVSDTEYLEKYRALKEREDRLKEIDNKVLLNKFINNELNLKDFEEKIIEKEYEKILVNPYETYSKPELDEINENVAKLAKTLDEYQKYLNYKYIFDEVIKIYNEKEKYKNTYKKEKKEIQKLEGKLQKDNKKYERAYKLKDVLFFKKRSAEKIKALTVVINSQILALKELYRKIEEDRVNEKIATVLTDNSTMYDAIFLASSFYTFLVETIMKEFPDVEEHEINEVVEKIREFITSPYINVINNITIKEEKDIALTIKDKYNLFNINITKADLEETVIGDLINTVTSILNAYNLEKSGLKLDEVKYMLDANKILEDVKEQE